MNTKLLLALLIAVVCHTHLLSATFYSRGTGNWSVAATWSQVACGGAASATIPAAGDNVIICAGNVVTQDVSASCNWMEIYGTLTINATFTLTITGCDGGNINGENFTIDGGSPGTVTNNGTILFDQGACGGTPFYSNSGTFSNTGICTINNGGDYSANGTFINSATVNITSTSGNSSFTNLVSINNTGGTFNVNSGSTFVNAGSFGGGNGTININAGGTY